MVVMVVVSWSFMVMMLVMVVIMIVTDSIYGSHGGGLMVIMVVMLVQAFVDHRDHHSQCDLCWSLFMVVMGGSYVCHGGGCHGHHGRHTSVKVIVGRRGHHSQFHRGPTFIVIGHWANTLLHFLPFFHWANDNKFF